MTSDTEIDFNAVSPDMRAHIEATLDDVAREHGVTILYAAESGSRAWGFASPDSDYDVRFIYAHERDWYTSLHEARDVIERPLDDKLVDLVGWDVRKALRLLLKSNPPLYEWLVSPIVYRDDGTFRLAATTLFERHASPRVLAQAYHSIARSQRPERGVGGENVKLKRYFYLIRPLLSLSWVVENRSLPPMNLQQLMADVPLPAEVSDAVAALRAAKRATPELGYGPRVPAIDEWASAELQHLGEAMTALPDHDTSETAAAADALFRRTVGL